MPLLTSKPAHDLRRQRTARDDDKFRDTLDGYGKLLQGRFHRAPDGVPPTPVGVAIKRLVEFLQVKPLPVRPHDAESRDDYLERAALTHGLRLRRIRIDEGDSPEGGGALLVFDRADRPLLLLPRGTGGFTIEDPNGGAPPRRLREQDWQDFSAEVFAFYRTLPDGKLTYRNIVGFGLKDSVWDIGLLVTCGLIGAALAMLPPIASEQIANIGVHTADVAFLANLLVVLVFALVAETCFFLIGRLAELRVQGRSGIALHAAMLDRLLRLPSPTLRASNTLILATQTETVEKFRRGLLSFAASGVLALANGLAAAALVAFVSPVAGLVGIALVMVLVGIAGFLGWAQFKAIYEGERMDVVVLAFVYDLVRLIPILRAGRMEKRAFTQWSDNFLAFQSRLMQSARISNRLSMIEPLWEALALMLCFAALAYAGATGQIFAGGVIVFVMALGHLMRAGREMAHVVMGASKLMPMAKLARPLLELPIEPLSPGAPGPALSGRVEMTGVNFFYGAKRVLDDVSLDIAQGEFIGLVGPSGSGKSTLLNVLIGLDRPESGHILMDGYDLAGLDRRQIARQMGAVMQGSRLLPGTIYDNIRGVSSIGVDEAWDFAAQAGVDEELRDLPMGLHTIVSEGGSGLAAGQVQRILIARALAQKPAILVLDEAVSALDGQLQERILDRLARLKLTRIVVAHRPSTLAKADRVFVLQQGRIVDVGRMDEILPRHSFFHGTGPEA